MTDNENGVSARFRIDAPTLLPGGSIDVRVKVGETYALPQLPDEKDPIRVQVLNVERGEVRLGIDAPRHIPIDWQGKRRRE